MVIADILNEVKYTVLSGSLDIEVTNVSRSSNDISKGGLFFCIKGLKSDGHRYAEAAIKNGAVALVVETDIREELKDIPAAAGITIIKVENTRLAMPYISASFYKNPAKKLKIIAVVGTKGKTTTAYMIKDILQRGGHKTGLIGTIMIDDGENTIPAGFTTPEADDLHKYYARMLKNGCEIVVCEMSSQAFLMHRSDGIVFDMAVFTNISPDHIGEGEHKDFDDYFSCKKGLLNQARTLIYNADDDLSEKMIENLSCDKLISFSVDKKADFVANNIKLERSDDALMVSFAVGNDKYTLGLPGEFNVHNAMAAIIIAQLFNVSRDIIFKSLKDVRVPGRMELINNPLGIVLLIDYAHNAVSLKSTLTVLRKYEPKRLICLFGCGGNRSKDRRYQMGEVSGKMADLTVITSDNPRFEEPELIVDDIESAIKKTNGAYERIVDRRQAIAYVLANARKGDIVLLAGKGHETYQEIKGVKYPMDERAIIREKL